MTGPLAVVTSCTAALSPLFAKIARVREPLTASGISDHRARKDISVTPFFCCYVRAGAM